MTDKNYSIWHLCRNRWTNAFNGRLGLDQDIRKPFLLSLEDAKSWHSTLRRNVKEFVIREVLADGITGGEFYREDTAGLPIHSSTAPAVNDHVCPACGNTRCSKKEASCWICGSPLS